MQGRQKNKKKDKKNLMKKMNKFLLVKQEFKILRKS